MTKNDLREQIWILFNEIKGLNILELSYVIKFAKPDIKLVCYIGKDLYPLVFNVSSANEFKLSNQNLKSVFKFMDEHKQQIFDLYGMNSVTFSFDEIFNSR